MSSPQQKDEADRREIEGRVIRGAAGAVATTAVVTALTLRWVYKWSRRRLQRYQLSKYTRLELLPSERAPMICKSPPTITVTFFVGSTADAAKYFAARVDAIVAANPWVRVSKWAQR